MASPRPRRQRRGAGPETGPVADGFESFFAARLASLWRTAWLLTGDHQRAEDLVQSAVAKCYRKYDDLGPDRFEPYLRRVMLTTYLSWRGRRWNGELPTEELPDIVDPGGGHATGPHADLQADLRVDLVRALAGLPRQQRAVVVLRFVEDRSERETAEAMNISPGTVKSHTSRALAALRDSPYLRDQE